MCLYSVYNKHIYCYNDEKFVAVRLSFSNLDKTRKDRPNFFMDEG